ncbi:zinc finger CCCH domain-containing protein 14 isoform X2 [Anabrus simplex]|uniref:zinc finger CCCH domain-containing protein 14 isoform X2 n=1 Tax=Anabrus simplex TaxID=316456 RepID=UPI0035A29B47
MENIKAEVNGKIRSAIKAKLMELGAYVDEELPDYIMVMVVNKRTKVQMEDDLQLFLGANTEHFTVWLHQVLQKLEEVASLDKKAVKLQSSPSDQEGAERKRKTSTGSLDSDGHRKEKRRKSHDGKKTKKGIGEEDKEKERKKDADSSDSLEVDKNLKTASEESSSISKLNKEPLVSSSVDDSTSGNVSVAQKSPLTETHDGEDSLLKESAKSAVVSSSQLDIELVQSAVHSSDRTLEVPVEESKGDIKEVPEGAKKNTKTPTTPKVSSTLLPGSDPQSSAKAKIVLMHSDDEDDDEDFINIKADAEAEALLNEELPKESNLVTPDALTSPATEPLVRPEEKQISEKTRKADTVGTTSELEQVEIPVGTFDRKRLSTKDSEEPESSSLSLSERFARKRKGDKEAEVEDNRTTPASRLINTPVLSIKDRLGVKKVITSEPEDRPRQPVRVTDRLGLRAVTADSLKKRRMEPAGLSPVHRSTAQSIEKVLRDRISRRVPDGTNHQGESNQDQKKRPLLSRVVLPQPGREEEEYDPANPAVGTVASVVRVKPRPRLPAELQANKNLLLKAVAEAQKSVANVPIRPEPSSPSRRNQADSTFSRRAREANIAITLPNRRTQSFHDIQKRGELKDGLRHIGNSLRLKKAVLGLEAEDDLDHTIEVRVEEEDEEMLPDEGIVTEELDNEEDMPSVYPPVGLASRMPRERPQPPRSESPQFLVTLDGLDPSMFPAHNDSVDDDQCSPTAKVEEEDNDQDDNSSKVSSTPSPPTKEKGKSLTPIVYTKRDTASETDSTLPKSLERCKYWPSCRLGTKCTFHHPNTPCKSFPKCPFREKCLYIHPMCKFDSSCTRRDCPFMHVTFKALLTAPAPASKLRLRTARSNSGQTSSQVCKFFPKCANSLCRFLHPKPCRYGKFCSKPDCNYLHDELPPVDKLKWTSPFRT